MGPIMSSDLELSIAVQPLTLSRWPAKSNFDLIVSLQHEQFEQVNDLTRIWDTRCQKLQAVNEAFQKYRIVVLRTEQAELVANKEGQDRGRDRFVDEPMFETFKFSSKLLFRAPSLTIARRAC